MYKEIELIRSNTSLKYWIAYGFVIGQINRGQGQSNKSAQTNSKKYAHFVLFCCSWPSRSNCSNHFDIDFYTPVS